MKDKKIRPLKGEITVPGDKSISHRSVMLASIADGLTEVTGFLKGADCLSTIRCFRQLGISIEEAGPDIRIHGKGLRGLLAPSSMLDAGNSGTTTRLLSGILSAQDFTSELTGDASIQKRPMNRIIGPLTQMGACIESIPGNGCAPLRITGKPLHGIHHISEVASAQVKSAILLAGLYAEGETCVTEPHISRNHSETMLRQFGADIRTEGATSILKPGRPLHGQKIAVPGDISSAAYFIAAGLTVPGSELLIRNVGVNPTRDGILRTAAAMGAKITLLNQNTTGAEPVADLLVTACPLHGTVIEGDIIPALIDELPVIAVMAAYAEGTTVIRDAAELKVKESNRIDAMVESLQAMGCDIKGTPDGMIIRGGRPLHGAVIDSRMDHRIAMSFAVAGLMAEGETRIIGKECVDISYPGFFADIKQLSI